MDRPLATASPRYRRVSPGSHPPEDPAYRSTLLRHPLQPLIEIPQTLSDLPLELAQDGHVLVYTFDVRREETGIATLLKRLAEQHIDFRDLHSSESSLEDIFVSLVRTPS